MELSSGWTHIPDETSDDLVFTSIQKTEHYSFQVYLHYRCYNKTCTTIHMYVGPNSKMGCFSLSIPFKMKNNYSQKGQICHLSNIKRIRECLYESVSDEVWENYSSAIEILSKMIEILRIDFPYIKFIKFEDDSQLECSANPLNKLDLLYYSVATSGKTWYEKHFNAYFVPREKFIEYKCKVREFQSTQTKNSIPFSEIQDLIRNHGSDTAYALLKIHENQIEDAYTDKTTKILPDFFAKLNEIIPKSEKCYMYKEWIKNLVIKYIGEIERKWIIDVYKFDATQYGGKRYTRKNLKNKCQKM